MFKINEILTEEKLFDLMPFEVINITFYRYILFFNQYPILWIVEAKRIGGKFTVLDVKRHVGREEEVYLRGKYPNELFLYLCLTKPQTGGPKKKIKTEEEIKLELIKRKRRLRRLRRKRRKLI